ncbi:YihY family inner membrane protein, partial [bacterium]|nr:YihY family inner membrane protein [bacterium]
ELIETARGATFSGFSIVLILGGIFGIFSQIEATFNHIWGVTRTGMNLGRLPIYLGILFIVPVAVVVSFTLSTYIMALPLISQAVEHISAAAKLINWSVPFLLLTFAFFLLYRFLPRAKVKNRSAILGALIAGMLHELLKNGFILYTSRVVSYDVLYGSLSIIPVLLIWINLSWVAVLIGVEVSFVRQHWDVLIDRRKNVVLSRSQQDALSYLLLFEATGAFRNRRSPVTVDEWSNYGLPPSVVSRALKHLEEAGLVKLTDTDGLILLTRDPAIVPMAEVDRIIAAEQVSEWYWPKEPPWNWLKEWTLQRQAAVEQATDADTLEDFVKRIEDEALDDEMLNKLADRPDEPDENPAGVQEGTSRHTA